MKAVLALAVALVAMAVVASLSRLAGLESARLEIAAVIVAYACTSLPNAQAAMCAFAAGYLEDALCGHPTWLFPFAAMVGYLVGRVVTVIVDIRGPIWMALLTMLVDAGYQLAALGMLALFPGKGGGPSPALVGALVPTALLTGLGAVVLYPVLQRLDLAFDREESSLYLR